MSDFVRLLRADRVLEGRIVLGRDGIHPVAVVKQRGKLFAFRNRCPHAGAPLSTGTLHPGSVQCPRHGWGFELHDGSCPLHPLYELRLYELREVDGWIEGRLEKEEIW